MDLGSKLFYVMTAVESIFLTGGENVRDAVGRRLARCAAETYDDRVRVIGIFTNVYNTRSQNFHFLEPVEESGELSDFFQIFFSSYCKIGARNQRSPDQR